MRILANIISFLFHPIFIPTYAIIFLVYCNPYLFGRFFDSTSAFVIGNAVMHSILYPLFTVFLMKTLGFIESYKLEDIRERILVFMPVISYFFWTYTVYYKSEYNEILSDVMMGASIALVIGMIFMAFRDKISLHAIGMGGLFAIVLRSSGIALFDVTPFLFAAIILGGLVGTCRLILGAHTNREVYQGYFVGFICQAFALVV